MTLNKLLATALVAAFAIPVPAQNAPAAESATKPAPAKHKQHIKHKKQHIKKAIDKLHQGD